jgi:hypothetical protein
MPQNPPSAPLTETMTSFFRTKTACDVAGTMAYFSPDLATYTDATLGWDIDSYAALEATFEQYMPGWGDGAASYCTSMFSNEQSALLHMVDTPELFGGELRILAAVDVADGRIVRWVDYWDGQPFDAELYAQMRTPADAFPTDLKDDVVPTRAAPEIVATASALHASFTAGDGPAAGALLHTDVVLEDMTLRTRVLGRIEVSSYLERALSGLPYGEGSVLRHVVGGTGGGAFEWTSADGLVGITAFELDPDGLVTRITSVYDGRQLSPQARVDLLSRTFAS